ncbi:MAG: TA system antitoxin ParD family protein [Polynucleobacter sp.]|mgnify:CR=1 FL=1|jgi:ParD-like antitoxin of type II bacterial toxin-antitoxin system
MSIAIKLSNLLVEDAKPYAQAMHRSVPKQIEYWARLGKVAEENPDLPISMLQDILVGIEEVKSGNLTPYRFG